MRAISFILITMLLTCFGFNPLFAESQAEKTAVSAAQVWLSLIDSGNYSDSWNEASTYFRGAVTEQSGQRLWRVSANRWVSWSAAR